MGTIDRLKKDGAGYSPTWYRSWKSEYNKREDQRGYLFDLLFSPNPLRYEEQEGHNCAAHFLFLDGAGALSDIVPNGRYISVVLERVMSQRTSEEAVLLLRVYSPFDGCDLDGVLGVMERNFLNSALYEDVRFFIEREKKAQETARKKKEKRAKAKEELDKDFKDEIGGIITRLCEEGFCRIVNGEAHFTGSSNDYTVFVFLVSKFIIQSQYMAWKQLECIFEHGGFKTSSAYSQSSKILKGRGNTSIRRFKLDEKPRCYDSLYYCVRGMKKILL